MKNQYWILGDWDEVMGDHCKKNIFEKNAEYQLYERFLNISNDYVYLRLVVDNRTIVIEQDVKTDKMLLLTPVEEALYKDILRPEISDVFLDFLSCQAKILGYWPLREINFPES